MRNWLANNIKMLVFFAKGKSRSQLGDQLYRVIIVDNYPTNCISGPFSDIGAVQIVHFVSKRTNE